MSLTLLGRLHDPECTPGGWHNLRDSPILGPMSPLLFLLLAAPPAAPPINVLVILADDCTVWDLGCYGGQAATPNLDRLCEEGLRFERCFQAAPMCSPTRHALYTGLYPVRNGAWPNHARAFEGTRSVAHFMGEAGYRVALSGKSHVKPSSVYPFEVSSRKLKELRTVEPDTQAMDALFADCAESGTPFCLIACSNEPHGPWNRGDPSAYPPERVHLPPTHVDTPGTREAFSRYLAEVTYFDQQVGEYLALLEHHGLEENTLVIVLSEQGNGFPFAKWHCTEAGLASGMVVRWPGVVEPATTTRALVEYVDLVPTLLEAAGLDAEPLDGSSFLAVLNGESDTHDQFVYGLQTSRGINNGPSHYGIRTVRSERYRYILNLTPEARFRNATEHQAWFQEWVTAAEGGDAFAKQQVARHSTRPAEELYDVEVDPWCLHDLSQSKDHDAVKRELRSALHGWMASQGDSGQLIELRARERQAK